MAHASAPLLQNEYAFISVSSWLGFLSGFLSFFQNAQLDELGDGASSVVSGGWRACLFIIVTEFCEGLAFYGIKTNLVVYLTKVMHLGNASAAKAVTNWSGTSYLTAFLGAYLADSHWGRYRTIAVLSTVYAVGMLLFTLSASLPSLRPPPCLGDKETCEHASTGQTVLLYTALYIIALSTGGIKPCISAFGADQLNSQNPVEKGQLSSFFNWYYFALSMGALLASSVLVYVQENISWGLGFGLPTLALIAAVCIFMIGTPLYRSQKPDNSYTRMAQVLVAALRKWRDKPPTKDDRPGTDLRFLEKAAIATGDEATNSWQLCTLEQVEEAKTFMRTLPVCASTIFYSTVYAQMSTFFVEQGQRMNTEIFPGFKVPAASLMVTYTLSLLVLLPLYNWFLVPYVRSFTKVEEGFTSLQRMGIGLMLSTLGMLAAAAVEHRRLEVALEHDLVDNATDEVPMSIAWQVPQYLLLSTSEMFAVIGQIEFFYKESPDGMRSLGVALALGTVALGSYLSSLIVALTSSSGTWIPDNLNHGHLDYYFLMVAFLSALNQLWFWSCSRAYKRSA